MTHHCRFDDRGDCEECDHRGHLPKCLPVFAGGQGRSAEEVASIGSSLLRAGAVLVVLLLLACCAVCWGAG